MTIIAREVLSDRFTWNEQNRIFVAEASDFQRNLSGRVYDDACDAGFVMISVKTGGKILCLETSEKRDAENELLYTRFLCYDLRGRPLVGRLAGAEVHLLND